MAASLNTPVLKISLEALLSNTVGLATVSAPYNQTYNYALTNGTGANQADKIYTGTITIGPSSSQTLDVVGSVADALGTTMSLARVKAFIAVASSTNSTGNQVQITRSSTGVPIFNSSGAGVNLNPGGAFAIIDPGADGYAATAGSADLITFGNSAGTNTIAVSVIVIGASA